MDGFYLRPGIDGSLGSLRHRSNQVSDNGFWDWGRDSRPGLDGVLYAGRGDLNRAGKSRMTSRKRDMNDTLFRSPNGPGRVIGQRRGSHAARSETTHDKRTVRTIVRHTDS